MRQFVEKELVVLFIVGIWLAATVKQSFETQTALISTRQGSEYCYTERIRSARIMGREAC